MQRAARHSVRIPCQLVRERDFHLVGRHVVDLSLEGLRVLADRPVLTGEKTLVAMKVPFGSPLWLDAEAVVTRVLHGRRAGDGPRSLGLEFTWIAPEARAALERQLERFPVAKARPRLNEGVVCAPVRGSS
jgi:hypothetical protein